jgi:methylenetetrahydrofolate--tRNA-(uracil-5-)-methyltransferase
VPKSEAVWIIGAGLAGCEAALQLSRRGIPVRLFEMKPDRKTPAQSTDGYAELVCSNSFRSSSLSNAVGVIKEEMRALGGQLIQMAEECRVPAGDALAVDRERFSALVTQTVKDDPMIEVIEEEITSLPGPDDAQDVVVATGPLTAPDLAASIAEVCGDASRLYFYDAIAPIVAADSVKLESAYFASRYGKGNSDDYLNCPLNEEQYGRFIEAILDAQKVDAHDFEDAAFFEGCLPIEVIASRGIETLRYGCMKPVGLDDPRTGRWPHAVVQLRAENLERTAYNLVGFQTRLKWGDQKRIFAMIPGLENAEFLRLGQIHRNTYLDSPRLLDEWLRLKSQPHISFAGQITGVEGYVESTACGLLVGWMIYARRKGMDLPVPPVTTALGALHGHILGTRRPEGMNAENHVPSNINWGLFPRLSVRAKKSERKRLYGERAIEDTKEWQTRHRVDLAL